MKIVLHSHHTTLAELNITPLLDLVFVLLVIFIITTPQMMNGLELALPSGKSASTKPAKPAHIKVVGPNRVQLDFRSMTFSDFTNELARRKAAQPDIAVIVEGSDRVEYQAVVDVLEAVQQLNITQAGLVTAPGDALQNP